VRLLIDVNLSPTWAAYLRDAGHDAVHWTSIGPAGAPDEDIVRHAGDNGFVIVTRDLDFAAILAASHAVRPSVILLRGPRQFPRFSGRRIIEVLAQLADELAFGAVVTIDLGKTRFRLLPLDPQ